MTIVMLILPVSLALNFFSLSIVSASILYGFRIRTTGKEIDFTWNGLLNRERTKE